MLKLLADENFDNTALWTTVIGRIAQFDKMVGIVKEVPKSFTL
ncbi:hypothetical protein [Nostoc sp.]